MRKTHSTPRHYSTWKLLTNTERHHINAIATLINPHSPRDMLMLIETTMSIIAPLYPDHTKREQAALAIAREYLHADRHKLRFR